MIVCDYCGRNCYHDHSEYKVEAYQWDYNGYYSQNVLHLHKWCYDKLIDLIRTAKTEAAIEDAKHLLERQRDKGEQVDGSLQDSQLTSSGGDQE